MTPRTTANNTDDIDDVLLGKRPSVAELKLAVSVAQASTLITLYELVRRELANREKRYGSELCRIESPAQLQAIRDLLED